MGPAPGIDSMVPLHTPMQDGDDDLPMVGVVVSKRQRGASSDGVSIGLNPLVGESAARCQRLIATWSVALADPSPDYELYE